MLKKMTILHRPQSRSQERTYQNENPKKTRTNTIMMRSSISVPPDDLIKLEVDEAEMQLVVLNS